MTVLAASIGCVAPSIPDGAQPSDAIALPSSCGIAAVPTKATGTVIPSGRVLNAAIGCNAIYSAWLNVGATPITVGCIDFKFLTIEKIRQFEIFNSFVDSTTLTITSIGFDGQVSGIDVSVSVGDVFKPWTSNTIQVIGRTEGDPVVNGAIIISFDNGASIRICVHGLRILSLRQGEQSKGLSFTDPEVKERFMFDVVEHVSYKDTHQLVLQSFDPTFEMEQRLGAEYPYATKLINLINSKGNYPWVVAFHNNPLSHNGLVSGQTEITLYGNFPREVKEGDFIATYSGESYSITQLTRNSDNVVVSIDPPLQSSVPKHECVYPAAIMDLVSAQWKQHHGKFAEFYFKFKRDYANWNQRVQPNQSWHVLDGYAVFPFVSDGLEPVSGSVVVNVDEWRYGGTIGERVLQAVPRDIFNVSILLDGNDEINELKDWLEYHRTKYRPFLIRRTDKYYISSVAHVNATVLQIDDNFEANIFSNQSIRFIELRTPSGTTFFGKVVAFGDNTITLEQPVPEDIPVGSCITPLALVRQVGNAVQITYKRSDIATASFKVTAER